jgi:hypothetical protein
MLKSIGCARDADGNIRLELVDTPTGKTHQLVVTPEEARTIAHHLLMHANRDTQYVLAPAATDRIEDVFHAMVGAFNLMARGTLTADNIPSKYAHMFRAVE